VQQLDARGTYVTAVEIASMEEREGMVLLSSGGKPPYFLGRKLVENEAGVAYELY
jgi:hypothetical protein